METAVTAIENVFQFTPLREGRHEERHAGADAQNFNSRPSARGDGRNPPHHRAAGRISIHAPPRGATEDLAAIREELSISIHAPPRGATSPSLLRSIPTCYFNSRPSARGDTTQRHLPLNALYFNSRPSARGDGGQSLNCTPSVLFQFTPLREGRLLSAGVARLDLDFNSRPSARGDEFPPASLPSVGVFQFTPLREGRRLAEDFGIRVDISIHAPPRGATGTRSERGSGTAFQFTPLREGRRAPSAGGADGGNFNSRPSARGDSKRYAISANLLFNPYKSAWLNNSATQFVEIILVIFHRIIA